MDKTLLAHLYRAQVQRADMWRARLDSTTNWSVVCTAAVLTVAFSEPRFGPILIAMATVVVTFFMWMECRRYRYFELWSHRVRCLESLVFAPELREEYTEPEFWRKRMAATLEEPVFSISLWEAFGRRYRAVYCWLQLILASAWLLHIWSYPNPAASWSEVWGRQIGHGLDVGILFVMGALFQLTLLTIGVVTSRLRHAEGELL